MYSRILLSVDLHEAESWRRALPAAVEMARAFDAELHVVTVVPELPTDAMELYLGADTGERLARAAMENIRRFVADTVPAELEAHPHAAQGRIYAAILETAERLDCGLIVMGSHRPQMSDYLLGPNAARVVRHAACSVLVVRP